MATLLRGTVHMGIPSDLSFLQERTSAYYAGLDYRAFPFAETRRRLRAGQFEHVLYLKVLALLVDHVAVPPAFLVAAMESHSRSEPFRRALGDLFQEGTFVTAVHGTMADPVDFFWHKLEAGDQDERRIFAARKREATAFLKGVPLVHRDIPAMSSTFRDLLTQNILGIADRRLPPASKEQILRFIDEAEARGEVALSRMDFLNILKRLDLSRRQYRACHYAMNSAYYQSGAETYHSDIACLAVEEFSVLGSQHFNAHSHPIVIGYDPSLFFRVLQCHGITVFDVYNLTPEDLTLLKGDPRFLSFVGAYRDFVALLQLAHHLDGQWPRWRIARFKERLLSDIETRFHAEQRTLAKWILGEDVGSGLLTALLGGALGLAMAGPPGALAGAGIGLVGPLLKVGRWSVAETVASKLARHRLCFLLYVEYLREKLQGQSFQGNSVLETN